MKRALQVLEKHYGYKEFRKGQDEVIESILNNRDVLSIMPTGAGKSICYQIPSLIFDGLTIVVSPLISLMKDQVDALKSNGIEAAYLNSTLDKNEQDEIIYGIKDGKYKILYIAPERITAGEFMNAIHSIKVSQIAIDEAHCVSQWGHDFRVSYRNVAPFVDSFNVRPIVTAFTATASSEVRDDIVRLLKLNNPCVFVKGFNRDNLEITIIKGVNKTKFISEYIKKNSDVSGIIYCATRKEVESLYKMLYKSGVSVAKYHGGLPDVERKENQEEFIKDRIQVMVATNAFGMGIDKSNIRFVIHNNMPQTIEGYYQEIGRAGRDGEESECILLFAPGDIHMQKFLIDAGIASPERRTIGYKKLQDMTGLVYSNDCYRRQILNYFGDDLPEDCNKCSNCLSGGEIVDKTIDAQKVISCIHRMQRGYGINVLIDVLRASKNKKILSLGFDELSTYGIMKDYKKENLSEFINTLISHGYIEQVEGEYPVLKLNNTSIQVIKGEIQVMLKEVLIKDNRYVVNDLFEVLRAVRFRIAESEGVAPYIILGDASLREMSNKYPTTKDEILDISGVGQIKFEKYGEEFISSIVEYMESNNIKKELFEDKKETKGVIDEKFCVESDKELYEKLRTLREVFSKKEGKLPYYIIAKDTLLEISGRYPSSIDELNDIKGLGPKKIDAYGEAIIKLVNEYLIENDKKLVWENRGKLKLVIDGEERSHPEITIAMLEDGFKVNDISEKLEISISTILGYVTDYIKDTGDISFNLHLSDYYNEEEKQVILEACGRLGIDNIAKIKKEIPKTINYESIRAVILNKFYNIA